MKIFHLRFFLLCFIFSTLAISVCAQQPLAHSSRRAVRKLGIDSSRVRPVEISEEAEKKIFSDKDYVYKEDQLKRGRNFIQEIVDWFSRKAEDNTPVSQSRRGTSNSDSYSSGSSGSGSSWNGDWVGGFVIILFIIVIVAGLVALIATGKMKKLFTAKPLESPFDFKEITEDIEGLNIDKLIEQARLAGDYRLATRWWYLKLLKKFTVCDLISWKPHKTNHDYFRELQNTHYILPFKQASHVYEHVWYGEMPVSEEMYSKYTPQFAELERSINA